MASIYPLPNGPGNFNNYTISVPRAVDDDGFNARVDHQISDKDSFFARYSYETFRLSAPQGQANCCLPTPDVAKQVRPRPIRRRICRSPTSRRRAWLSTRPTSSSRTCQRIPRRLRAYQSFHRAVRLSGTTPPRRWAFRASTSPQYSSRHPGHQRDGLHRPERRPRLPAGQPAPDPLAGRGRHLLDPGPSPDEVRLPLRPAHDLALHGTSGRRPRGDMTFGKNFTNDPVTNTQGTGLATLLIGYISGGSGRSILLEPYYTTNQDHGMYFQDDWKVSPRLTLNLGVRYDIFMPDMEIRNRLVNFDLTNLQAGLRGRRRRFRARPAKKRAWATSDRASASPGTPAATARPSIRSGFGRQLLPGDALRVQHARASRCPTSSRRPLSATFPTTRPIAPPSRTINNPFPAIATVKPKTTAELNAASRRRHRPRLPQRDALHDDLELQRRAADRQDR